MPGPSPERDPAQLRPCVDVDVGGHARRVVERATSNKADARTGVTAENRNLAGRAAEDSLLLAAAAGHVDRVWFAGDQFDSIGLDEDIDDERAPGLPLAVEAVAAVCEQRFRREPVPNLSAGAAALEHVPILDRTNTSNAVL